MELKEILKEKRENSKQFLESSKEERRAKIRICKRCNCLFFSSNGLNKCYECRYKEEREKIRKTKEVKKIIIRNLKEDLASFRDKIRDAREFIKDYYIVLKDKRIRDVNRFGWSWFSDGWLLKKDELNNDIERFFFSDIDAVVIEVEPDTFIEDVFFFFDEYKDSIKIVLREG